MKILDKTNDLLLRKQIDLPKDLISGIRELKAQKQALILAHYYQYGEIQDLADYVGDSLGLARTGMRSQAKIILLAGVVFMGETAKILSPEKKVICPDLNAGCSLSDNCPADKFKEFISKYPDHRVVTYVNCSAEVKALSDILCTSSNAEKVIASIPADVPIIFAPDRHLGAYLMKKTGRKMLLWEGSCIVHETFDAKKIVQLVARNPDAIFIAHPECPEVVLDLAEHIGSTSSLLDYVKKSSAQKFIVATEEGILHQMRKACPEKTLMPAPVNESCNCAECPYMKLNTLEKIYCALRDETPEIFVPEEIRKRAVLPLERMLAVS